MWFYLIHLPTIDHFFFIPDMHLPAHGGSGDSFGSLEGSEMNVSITSVRLCM